MTARGNWRGWPMRCSTVVLAAGAARDGAARTARSRDARFAVLGYGSLGGEELGFGSDLDVVFLYDAAGDAHSDGARPLDAPRWFARLAQKIVALLGAVTSAGRLYDVDVRLRPDGAKGLLVSTLASFADYQRERAWTWEHQALVRARCVAGDAVLCDAFEQVRDADAVATARCRRRCATTSSRCARRCAPNWIAPTRSGASTSSRAKAGWSTWNSCCSTWCCAMRTRAPALLRPRDTPGLLAALCDAGSADADDLRRPARRARDAARCRPALHARPAPAHHGRNRCDRRGARRDPRGVQCAGSRV